MYSIYHFFKSLVAQRHKFTSVRKLEDFPFQRGMLSCRSKGAFLDMAIRLNKDRTLFTGGELVELKDSDSYIVSSFNSTIPSRSKSLSDIISGEHSAIFQQMKKSGDEPFSLPEREVYYLVRGKKSNNTKVCLVYGSFFETVATRDLISQSFLQVLEERLKQSGANVPPDIQNTLVSIFSEQENFSKVRTVQKASVRLRFRIMTEVQAEGNILNAEKYPDIKDNTFNFLLPFHNDIEEQKIRSDFAQVFTREEIRQFGILKLKHHFNGWFLVFHINL